jgi:tetratricopeptide (TPR) repeat protein
MRAAGAQNASRTRSGDCGWNTGTQRPPSTGRDDRALAALDFPAAEGILARLVGTHPDFAEAWNKRATLYYMQSRDEESVVNIHRTLELEPRHYGAICGFAQICLSLGDTDSALFAFDAALRVNPHLENVREAIDKLLRTRGAAALH